MLIDILQQINEGRAEKGQGSKAGREKYTAPKEKKSSPVKARKSRVRIFGTIQDALKSSAPFGSIFSTKGADRLYVISRKKWGKDKESQVGVRIAKGFTPGSATPSASWPSIKAHSVRTMLKHGGSKSKRLTAKYGAGKRRPEEKRYAGKKVKESIEALHEALPLIPAALGAIRAVGTKIAGRGATVAKGAVKSGTKKSLAKKVMDDGPRVGDKETGTKPAGSNPVTQKVSHTEYEGPSLREKLACIYEVVSPGVKAARKSSYVRGGTEHPEKVRKARGDVHALLGPMAKAKGEREKVKSRRVGRAEVKTTKAAARRKQRGGGASAEDIGMAVAKYGPYGKDKEGEKKPPKWWRVKGRHAATAAGVVHSSLTAAGKAIGTGRPTQKVS